MKYVVYTDGSYVHNDVAEAYGFAASYEPCCKNPKVTLVEGAGNKPEYLKHHNVAPEILAVVAVCEQLIAHKEELNLDEVELIHDYEGIGKWINGEWKKTNYELTQQYKKYMLTRACPILNLTPTWVKAHTGKCIGNTRVDFRARENAKAKLRELSREV